jgi:hypothetical protein
MSRWMKKIILSGGPGIFRGTFNQCQAEVLSDALLAKNIASGYMPDGQTRDS